MEQKLLRGTNSCLSSQEIPHLLWSSKVYYYIYNILPQVSVLSQTDPITHSSALLKLPFNTIIPSAPMSSKWFLPFRFYNQNVICICSMHATWPVHFILCDMIILTIFGDEWKLQCSTLSVFGYPPRTSFPESPDILHSTLCGINCPSFFHTVRDQVSHP